MDGKRRSLIPRITRNIILAVIVALAGATSANALPLDICGCADSPASLGDFRSTDMGTYPPGTTYVSNGGTITIPLPPGGILIFDSFVLGQRPDSPQGANLLFKTGADNSPVRILVAGDVRLDTAGTTGAISLRGAPGSSFTGATPGAGGVGAPGGFRGGDGAIPNITSTTTGGSGLGPGGGDPGTPDLPIGSNPLRDGMPGSYTSGGAAAFVGGGGGGGGSVTDQPLCAGGGGGGGGGSILIAANGTITISGSIDTEGGSGATSGELSCSGRGGQGAPGAIRLIASTIAGSGQLIAGNPPIEGEIALEAFTITFGGFSGPTASRTFMPGAIFPPTIPRIAIASVSGESVSLANGEPISELPQGGFGNVDVVVNGIDPVDVAVASESVPGGTGVQVTAKPRTGGNPVNGSGTLGNCDGDGDCTASVSLNLPPGVYFVEAQATFLGSP